MGDAALTTFAKLVDGLFSKLSEELPEALYDAIVWGRELATLPQDLSRVLCIASTKQMLSSAIAAGYSLELFANPNTHERLLTLGEVASLDPGTRIRITYRESTIVGNFETLNPRTITVSVNGEKEEFGLVSPKNQPDIYTVPDEGPEGIYKYFLPEDASEQARVFASQRAAGLAIIGPKNLLDEELSVDIQADSLLGFIGTTTSTMKDFGRVDGLLEDKLPHYVNVFISRTDFWKYTEAARAALAPFNTVLLVGNDTINELAGHGAFERKRLIGIVEAADGRNFESAIHQFVGTTNMFYQKSVPKFDESEKQLAFVWTWGGADGL
jgi:hypothetical protein